MDLTIMTSNGWKINSIDIKTAFPWNKYFKRNMYLAPPQKLRYNIERFGGLRKVSMAILQSCRAH